jgi:short-chain fatty acids transporter
MKTHNTKRSTDPTDDFWLVRFMRFTASIVPEAISTAALMLVVVVTLALLVGNTLLVTMDAWYRGLWMLLPFTMQMTLILVLGSVLASTPLFKRIITSISRIPRTPVEVIALSVLLVAFLSYLNWGLALTLGPLIAVHFAHEAEIKGIPIDFPFLLAVNTAAISVWQFGLSATGPLMMATSGHFLENVTGVMPLHSTIWSPAAIFLVLIFPPVLILTALLLMPRKPQQLSMFPEALELVQKHPLVKEQDHEESNFSTKVEHSRIVTIILCIALFGWLYYHFLIKGSSLDLNSLNTIFLLFCFLLCGNIRKFSKAVEAAVVSSWTIIVLYHLYAGIAGLIQFTTIGQIIASLFTPFSTKWTFTFLTIVAGTIVAIFVPSSGGQWVIQGFVTTTVAKVIGLTPQRGMLALGVGDQMGNLISPFWYVIIAKIARIDFRTFYGYGLIFALVWLLLGIIVFTFLPC